MNWDLIVDDFVKKRLKRMPRPDAERISEAVNEFAFNWIIPRSSAARSVIMTWIRKIGFTYNTFEVILFFALFVLAIISITFWEDATTAALIFFVAIFGYSKFYRTWQLEDEIERLQRYKKLFEECTRGAGEDSREP